MHEAVHHGDPGLEEFLLGFEHGAAVGLARVEPVNLRGEHRLRVVRERLEIGHVGGRAARLAERGLDGVAQLRLDFLQAQ